ncbi:MAG TPA: hypothetical protein VGC31_09495 [Paenirhodobacter sp.]
MFANPYLLGMLAACAAVIAVLLAGVLVYGRSPDAAQGARRMRQLRIGAQVAAFGLVALFILMRDKF